MMWFFRSATASSHRHPLRVVESPLLSPWLGTVATAISFREVRDNSVVVLGDMNSRCLQSASTLPGKNARVARLAEAPAELERLR